MAGPIRISILADSRSAIRGINNTARASESLAQKIKAKAGPAIAIGFGLAAAAAVKFGTDAVKAASDAEQSIGATESIYDKYAKTVIKRSNQAARAVGLSANSYRESANLLGALFKNQGVALEKLSGTTDKHITLAADLSAMYGGDVTLAVEALTAAYKGEFNQLEKYGVTLKQSIINTRAETLAKQKYGKALKDLGPKQQGLAKQLATQALLFEQTTDAAGTFAKESDTLAGKQQRLAARFDNIKAKIGAALLPVLIDLAAFADAKLLPVLEKFSKYLTENKDEIRATAKEWGGKFLSALENVWKILKPILQTIDSLPGPIKSMAAQAVVAALILPKVAAALLLTRNAAAAASLSMVTFGQRLAQNRAAMTYATGVMGKAQAAMHGFGGAARNAAGIGGILLLTQGMQKGNTATGALMTTLGGMATGFALGGPIGAAVGGLASTFMLLKSNTDKSTAATERARAKAVEYKESLDPLTGAITAQTRALSLKRLEEAGALTTGLQLGLTQRQLINASLGQKGATEALNTALFNAGVIFDETGKAVVQYDSTGRILKNDLVLLSQVVADNTRTTEKNAAKVRETAAATTDYGNRLKGLPKRVSTYIENTGVEGSLAGIAKVVKKARELAPDLSKRDIKTIISVSGFETSVREVNRFIKSLDSPAKAAKASGSKTGRNLAAGTGEGVRNGKNLWEAPYKESLVGGAGGKTPATSGGQSVGRNLAAGTAQGIAQGLPWVTAAARIMALNAKIAAENALGIQSPSRVFKKIGAYTVEGLILGMQSGASGVESALSKITTAIQKAITGKREKQRESALLKNLKDEYAALKANGKAQDRVNAKLDEARQKLQTVRDWVAQVKASFVDMGNVTLFGKLEDGSVSGPLMLDQLRGAVQRAERFAALIRELTSKGLNKTSLDQLLQAGPEAALATAEALSAGGSAAVAEVNTLTGKLATMGQSLGTDMSDKFFTVGLRAAEGLVAGLTKQQKDLDKAAERMAEALIKKVKKALGIKSPSREFSAIGDQVTKGLVLGLDETYVKKSGAVLASSLQKGFGAPALAAVASGGGKQSIPINITLTAAQIDQLSRGKSIRADLDAWDAVGGRSTAA